MNKYFKIYIVTVLSCLSLQSCDDFLAVEPHSGIEGDGSSAITNTDNGAAALVGLYDGLQHYYSYGRDFMVYGDVMTDNVQLSSTNSNRFTSEAVWGWTSSTADMFYFWDRTYNSINRANNILNADMAGTEAKVNQIKGEAYAIRALLYFDLVRMYAQDYNFTSDHSHLGVPYVTKHDPNGSPFRNTVKEVYDGILSDLSQAAAKVTTAPSSPYTVSPNLINAIYARVYLYMGDYVNALKYAELVIPKYSLVTNDNYISSWGADYSTETIWALVFSSVDYNGTNGLGYIYLEGGYGDLLVNPTFLSIYASDDVRRGWFAKGVAASKVNNTYVAKKYPGTVTPGLDNINLFRVSEMYLIAAEAAARQGKESLAITYLDAIKKRAIPSSVSTTATGQKLIDEILLEKRKELAFEGQYFHDLKRLHLPIVAATAGNGKVGETILYGDHRLAWPIPQKEVEANPNIATQQNPEY